MVLGLQLRHNALRHTFGLLLTIALGCLGWLCWKRTREAARLRRSNAAAALRVVSSSVASPPPPIAISIPSAIPVHPNPTPHVPLPFRPFKPSSPSPSVAAAASDIADLPPIKNSDCPICLSAFEIDALLTVLPSCNHAYHPSCIHQWLQSLHKDCPICRAEIPHI